MNLPFEDTRLILMRHAKSDWANEGLSDHDRPLNERGQRDVPEMARWLEANQYQPDLILCSSAVRTRQTADRLTESWSSPTAVFVTKRLYLASAQQIFSVLREDAILPNEDEANVPSTVLVLAHNPGVSEAVGWLTGQMVAMPTAALVVMNRSISDWNIPIAPEQMDPVAIMKPKALPIREG